MNKVSRGVDIVSFFWRVKVDSFSSFAVQFYCYSMEVNDGAGMVQTKCRFLQGTNDVELEPHSLGESIIA